MRVTSILFILTCSLHFTSAAQFKNDLQRQKIKGRAAVVTEKEYNASGDSLEYTSTAKYGSDGNETEFATYSPTGEVLSRTVFKYNDSGRIQEEDRYKADGSLNVKTTYQFDAKGNKIEEEDYDGRGNLFLKVLCKYDGRGNRLVKDSYNEFGILFLKRNSKYDDNGNESEAKEYDSHHGLQFSLTYDYGHEDNAGNWTKRTMYKNDDAFSVTERTIEYR